MVPDEHLRVCRPNSGVKFFVEVGEKPDRPFLFILFGVLQNPKSTTVQLGFAFHDADDVQKRDGVFVFSFYQVKILVVVANYPRVFANPNQGKGEECNEPCPTVKRIRNQSQSGQTKKYIGRIAPKAVSVGNNCSAVLSSFAQTEFYFHCQLLNYKWSNGVVLGN